MVRVLVRLAALLPLVFLVTSASLPAANAEAPFTVGGNVQHGVSVAAYRSQGGMVFSMPDRDVQLYMPSVQYYEVQGSSSGGRWDYPISVRGLSTGVVDLIEVGANVTAHTELVAVGAPSSGAPARMLSRNAGDTAPSSVTASACLPNYRQLQATTTWYEYDPQNPTPAHISMAQLVTSEGYYYGSSQINCQQGNDAVGQYYTWYNYNHAFLDYIDSGPTAAAASDVSYQGPSLYNGQCVRIDVNGQTDYGYSNGTYAFDVNTHAYYCNSSSTPGDFFYSQTTAH